MSTSNTSGPHDDTAPATAPPALADRTAARRVYDLLHIRAAIIRQLERPELAKLLRVDKKGMEMVVRELYHKMEYNKALKIASIDEARLEMYNSAVVIINARDEIDSMNIPTDIAEAFGFEVWGSESETEEEQEAHEEKHYEQVRWLQGYHPEMVDLLVPPLLARFPFLRTMELGEESNPLTGIETWSVHLPSRNTRAGTPALSPPPTTGTGLPPDSSSPPPSPPPVGHINHVSSILIETQHEDPPTVLPTPLDRPSQSYTIHQQFDLSLYHPDDASLEPVRHDKWLVALRTAPWLASLSKGLDTGPLRVTTKDLALLYSRQDSSNHGMRLAVIDASNIIPPTIPDFAQFAKVAGSSLTSLRLCSYADADLNEDDVKMSFKDLPALLGIVRTDLPKLSILVVAMKGVSSAEQGCRELLAKDTLEQRGSLRALRIFTVKPPSFLFNTLRYVSTICQSGVEVAVGPKEDCWLDGAKIHSRYIQYLRSRPRVRREVLSIANFTSLDITTPEQVEELRFYPDGQPRRRGDMLAHRWLKGAKETERKATRDQLPSLAERLTRMTAEASRLMSVSKPEGSTRSVLEATRSFLDSAEKVTEAAEFVQGIIGETQRLYTEVEDFLLGLEDIELGPLAAAMRSS